MKIRIPKKTFAARVDFFDLSFGKGSSDEDSYSKENLGGPDGLVGNLWVIINSIISSIERFVMTSDKQHFQSIIF